LNVVVDPVTGRNEVRIIQRIGIAFQIVQVPLRRESTVPRVNQAGNEKKSDCEEVIDMICNALEITQRLSADAHGELNQEVYSLAAILHEALRKAANIYNIITVKNRSVARSEKESNKVR
jgi:hypothetical protein